MLRRNFAFYGKMKYQLRKELIFMRTSMGRKGFGIPKGREYSLTSKEEVSLFS